MSDNIAGRNSPNDRAEPTSAETTPVADGAGPFPRTCDAVLHGRFNRLECALADGHEGPHVSEPVDGERHVWPVPDDDDLRADGGHEWCTDCGKALAASAAVLVDGEPYHESCAPDEAVKNQDLDEFATDGGVASPPPRLVEDHTPWWQTLDVAVERLTEDDPEALFLVTARPTASGDGAWTGETVGVSSDLPRDVRENVVDDLVEHLLVTLLYETDRSAADLAEQLGEIEAKLAAER